MIPGQKNASTLFKAPLICDCFQLSLKKNIIFLLSLLTLFVTSASILCSMQKGYKFIRNYSYLEYDNQAQNWGVVQAENGILYFANQGGGLESDGVT